MKKDNKKSEFDFKDNFIWNGLLRIQRGIMIFSSIFVIIVISLAVVLRYIFKTDLYGLEEIVTLVAFWLYFIGSSYGSYEKSQISADILTMYLRNKKHKQIVTIIASLITTAMSILGTYWAFQFFVWGIVMRAASPVYRIPMVIPQSSIFISFCLMSLYNLVYLFEDIKSFFIKEKEEGAWS
ncbi:MAG: TRAP-type transport system small permease protein [Clostridia bacterium]|nr:TRAP-type transport system small permease protein [Clostridia bacterium]